MLLIFWLIIPWIPAGLYLLKQYMKGGVNKYKTDMSNKFIIITGASGGWGKESAITMINAGAKVIFACRNKEKAEAAMRDIPNDKKENGIFMTLDLCSFESIKSFAEEIRTKYPLIDILINNAGAAADAFKITKDNLESFVQGNHLGPMYLTLLLLDRFSKTDARIINVSSLAHNYSGLTEKSPSILKDPNWMKEEYFSSMMKKFVLYSDSKLMNIYFTQYLTEWTKERYPSIKSMSLHPGCVNTEFFRTIESIKGGKILFKLISPIWNLFTKTAAQGAQVYHYLCMIPSNLLTNGAYYSDCKEKSVSQKAENKEIRKGIIEWSWEEIKKRDDKWKI